MRRMVFTAGTVLFAVTLAACGASDGDNTTARKSYPPVLHSAPAAPPTESTVPVPSDDSKLIIAAKACTVVTEKILEAVIPDSTFVSLGSGGPMPADPTHEQRCGYTGRVGGQYNDNPNTPGSEFTLQVTTEIDDKNATEWNALRAVDGAPADTDENSNEILGNDLGIAGRKAGGRLIVKIDSVDDTDSVVSTEQYVVIIQRALNGLKVG
jgi:hypothetical protein